MAVAKANSYPITLGITNFHRFLKQNHHETHSTDGKVHTDLEVAFSAPHTCVWKDVSGASCRDKNTSGCPLVPLADFLFGTSLRQEDRRPTSSETPSNNISLLPRPCLGPVWMRVAHMRSTFSLEAQSGRMGF